MKTKEEKRKKTRKKKRKRAEGIFIQANEMRDTDGDKEERERG